MRTIGRDNIALVSNRKVSKDVLYLRDIDAKLTERGRKVYISIDNATISIPMYYVYRGMTPSKVGIRLDYKRLAEHLMELAQENGFDIVFRENEAKGCLYASRS